MTMKFRTVVVLGGKNATGIEVPADVVEQLGAGKKPPVRVTVNGHTYLSTVAVMGGKFMLPLSAENRGAAGVAAGEEVEVELALDKTPREVVVPEDLLSALNEDAAAKSFFEGLSYSNKRRIVMNVEQAKTAETRQRRIGKYIESLREGKV